MFVIENNELRVEIAKKGAEIKKLINKANSEDYMWRADSAFWGKTAPVLFPFIGGQNHSKFKVDGEEFAQLKHGFARDYDFDVVEEKADYIKFVFSSNDETFAKYPYDFDFYIVYYLEGNKLFTKYIVDNNTADEMYFSVGAHPAFATPVNDDLKLDDYYIEFEKEEDAETFLLDGVLLTRETKKVLSGNILELKEDTFAADAYVFENLNSTYVTLKNKKNSNAVKVSFEGFPYCAFWNIPGADFLCIEPWYGINDFVDFEGDLSEKAGTQVLYEGETFEAVLSFEIV
jgi:galactose mutarotase-like enzyme